MMIAAVATVLVGVVSVMGVGGAMGMLTYGWMRRSLYRRPLTEEERWAETTQQEPESLVDTTAIPDDADEDGFYWA